MAYTVLTSEKIVNGKVQKGILLYPSNRGRFRSSEDATAFQSLFSGVAPRTPYTGAGKRFGPESFSDTELRNCILEHMEKYYSRPKDINSYWDADSDAHHKMIFPLVTPNAEILDEDPKQSALRGIWECSGVKVKAVKYVTTQDGLKIFTAHIPLDQAKWSWMDHQAERLTLTDWGACSYANLLDELGIPKIVLHSYCRTHGGPRFVSNVEDHTIEESTKKALLYFEKSGVFPLKLFEKDDSASRSLGSEKTND